MSRFLAIDLDAQGVFVAAGAVKGGSARAEQALAWVPGADHGPPVLSAETARALGEGLRERLKAAGIAPAPALVSVGRDRVIFREVSFPAVPPSEEAAVVRFQALKELPDNPDDLVLDYTPLPDAADGQRRATVVVVRKDVFAAVQAMCTAAGLRLAAVTPRPFAVAAGLAAAVAAGEADRPPDGTDAAVATLGPGGGEFTVVRGSAVTFTRSVAAQVVVNDALLASELKRNAAVNPGPTPIGVLYVAEPEGRVGGWAARLRRAGYTGTVKAFDPLVNAPAQVPDELRGRFAAAAGLLAAKAAGALPINFASPRQPRAAVDPNRKLLIVAGAAAAVVFLVGGALGYYVLNDAEGRLTALQEEKADLEKQLADLGPDRERLKAADGWRAREVNYLDELYDLADRMPADDKLRVTKVEAVAQRIDKTGKQDSQALLKVSVGAKNPDPASALLTAFERDNLAGKKYYVGTQKQAGTLATGGTAYNWMFTLVAKVNHRDPPEYTRQATFTPPPRRGAYTPAAAPAATTPAEDEEP
ncbi:MAG TPA: hypothetical protein VD866_09040 [Urbifossiella sp.]|nr:hypothetical protein [Urbifossiella sp.]